MSRRFWTIWGLANVAWLVGVPVLFGIWLQQEVRAEYLSGARVSTDGDSISIPIFGLAILNAILLLVVNLGLGAYAFFKRRRAT